MKDIARILIGLLMPLILVVGGGWLVGVGIDNNSNVLFWMGVVMVAVGLIWGLVLYLWSSASWF